MDKTFLDILSVFLQLIFSVGIAALVPVLTVILYKWGKARWQSVEHMLTSAQLAEFRAVVIVVISAAEQSGLAGLIRDVGSAKKAYAIDTLQAVADSWGFKISLKQIDAEIESAISMGLHTAPTMPGSMGFDLPDPDAHAILNVQSVGSVSSDTDP